MEISRSLAAPGRSRSSKRKKTVTFSYLPSTSTRNKSCLSRRWRPDHSSEPLLLLTMCNEVGLVLEEFRDVALRSRALQEYGAINQIIDVSVLAVRNLLNSQRVETGDDQNVAGRVFLVNELD